MACDKRALVIGAQHRDLPALIGLGDNELCELVRRSAVAVDLISTVTEELEFKVRHINGINRIADLIVLHIKIESVHFTVLNVAEVILAVFVYPRLFCRGDRHEFHINGNVVFYHIHNVIYDIGGIQPLLTLGVKICVGIALIGSDSDRHFVADTSSRCARDSSLTFNHNICDREIPLFERCRHGNVAVGHDEFIVLYLNDGVIGSRDRKGIELISAEGVRRQLNFFSVVGRIDAADPAVLRFCVIDTVALCLKSCRYGHIGIGHDEFIVAYLDVMSVCCLDCQRLQLIACVGRYGQGDLLSHVSRIR